MEPKFTYLIKTSHRLIRAPDLHLKIRRLLALTTFPRTLHALLLLRVIPRPRPAKDVFPLGSREGFALVIPLGQEKLVGAGEAFEAVDGAAGGCALRRGVGRGGLGDGEDVAAGGADFVVVGGLVWGCGVRRRGVRGGEDGKRDWKVAYRVAFFGARLGLCVSQRRRTASLKVCGSTQTNSRNTVPPGWVDPLRD